MTQASHAVTVVGDEVSGFTGITGISIAGYSGLWDVTFNAGSFSLSGAPLTTSAFSLNATNALLDLFASDTLGAIDTAPETAIGCGNTGGCYLATPYESTQDMVKTYAVWNEYEDRSDYLGSPTLDINIEKDIMNYVTWTPTAVPLPGALWLFGSALAGFGFITRKRKGVEAT